MWNELVDALPYEFLGTIAKQVGDLRIGVNNIALGIGNDHGIGRGRGHQLQQVFRLLSFRYQGQNNFDLFQSTIWVKGQWGDPVLHPFPFPVAMAHPVINRLVIGRCLCGHGAPKTQNGNPIFLINMFNERIGRQQLCQ